MNLQGSKGRVQTKNKWLQAYYLGSWSPSLLIFKTSKLDADPSTQKSLRRGVRNVLWLNAGEISHVSGQGRGRPLATAVKKQSAQNKQKRRNGDNND